MRFPLLRDAQCIIRVVFMEARAKRAKRNNKTDGPPYINRDRTTAADAAAARGLSVKASTDMTSHKKPQEEDLKAQNVW